VTASLVFTADRADHIAREIRPALERGEWVISDRYLLSTIAYQGVDVDRRAILACSQGFPVPAVTFVLEAAEDARTARMASRGRTDRYEDPALAERLRASYEQAVALLREAGHRIEKVDAAPPAEEVLAEILRRLPA
jgi:dTMP kinase